ncbi:hypothetical protein BJ878DRAFT_112552 [Calycina marina]|uniref:Zn(2)-C6 fungal-type domain-containing protein n=1 Tax=Calycina marina TaxID=1763456 RepID=A0A9P8CEB0_9HELO|nr:hypothetical protein BJ878DRAFT_112552 [Calycina marina]
MTFRKICPSLDEDSAELTSPSLSTPEPTLSDPCRVQNGNVTDAAGANSLSNSNTSKRRRVPESVTRNACLNCRKARAKCDGRKPCKRCATRTEASDCIYEVHVKHAKEELVKQIKDLLAKEHLTEQILQALSVDEQVPEILNRLKKGEPYAKTVEWLGRPLHKEFKQSPRDSYAFLTSDYDMGGMTSRFSWTAVTKDTGVLDHLFQLYFAWIHPVHTLFSEGHFVDSYKRKSTMYCSSVLVNAICAMACHLHTASDKDTINFRLLGNDFTNAVRAETDSSDRSITAIQASAVMFLVLIARADALRATAYWKIAARGIPNVKVPDVEGFNEVWLATVCGIRNLNSEWAQITFCAPSTVLGPLNHFEDGDNGIDEARWYCYRNVRGECPAWPSLLATTNRQRTKLVAIIDEVSTMFYSPIRNPITARQVLHSYSKLAAWRESLPHSIGGIENRSSPLLPHALSLLIMYETAVVHLLRPLLDLRGFPASSVEATVWSHAQRGLSLLDEQYRLQYSFTRQPVLQMFYILHLSDVVARFFSSGFEEPFKDGPGAIAFGLGALSTSKVGFPIASPLHQMLRTTADDYSIQLPKELEVFTGSRRPSDTQVFTLDQMIESCTMPTYSQPIAEIHSRYLSSFSADWIDATQHGGLPGAIANSGQPSHPQPDPNIEERAVQNLMQIRNLLNTT